MTTNSSYENLRQTIANEGLGGSVSEIQGSMTGMLCIDTSISIGAWMKRLDTDENNPIPNESGIGNELILLFNVIRDELSGGGCEFSPLLPDENTGLPERAAALAEWCHGFLFGIGTGAAEYNWSKDCQELISDIVEISRLDPESEDDDGEESIMQLIEYVRVAVEVICEEAHAGPGSASA